MAKVTIPLVGSNTSRDSTNSLLFGSTRKDQWFRDAHVQLVTNGVTGKVTGFVSARQQYSDGPNPSGASGAGTAIRVWRWQNGEVMTAFGNTDSTVYRGSDSIGTISGQAKFIDEAFAGAQATLFITSTDHTGWYYPQDAGTGSPTFVGDLNSSTSITNVVSTSGLYEGQMVTHANIPANTRITGISGSTVTIGAAATATAAGQTITRTPIAKILDAQYPGNNSLPTTGRFVQLDGTVYVMDTRGNVWGADVNSATSWTSTNYINTQEYVDPGIGVARLGRMLIGFSANSTEFFYNAGNATGSPLARVQGATSRTGCVNQYAYCDFGDTVAFIGRLDGATGVYLLNGTNPVKISDSVIDALLSASNVSNARLNTLVSWGQPRLVLTLSSSSTNMHAYDPATKFWHPWTLDDPLSQSDTQSFSTTIGAVYVGASNSTYMAIGNSPATAALQIGRLANGRRVFVNSLRLIGDRAVSTLNIGIAMSYDDGQNFSTARDIDVSKENQILYRLGSGRTAHVRITGLSGVSSRPHRLEAIELDLTQVEV